VIDVPAVVYVIEVLAQPRSEASMDSSSFERCARRVTAETSRRSVVTSAFASALAGFGGAAWLDPIETAAKKKRKKKKRCRHWILSGGSDPTAEIFVDDDLKVLRNGQAIIDDHDGLSSTIDPIHFTARKGAKLRIVAFDALANCHELSPLYLQCKGRGGSPRKLTNGVPETCPNEAVGEFFNETFTI